MNETQISQLKDEYEAAEAASEAALNACYASPKDMTLQDEFGRLFTICGKARRAYEAASKVDTFNMYRPDDRILQADHRRQAAFDKDA